VQSLIDVNVANLPGLTALPHLYEFMVVGPTKVTGVSDTPSREHLFACHSDARLLNATNSGVRFKAIPWIVQVLPLLAFTLSISIF
jgi:hypothetical protein